MNLNKYRRISPKWRGDRIGRSYFLHFGLLWLYYRGDRRRHSTVSRWSRTVEAANESGGMSHTRGRHCTEMFVFSGNNNLTAVASESINSINTVFLARQCHNSWVWCSVTWRWRSKYKKRTAAFVLFLWCLTRSNAPLSKGHPLDQRAMITDGRDRTEMGSISFSPTRNGSTKQEW